MNCMHCNKACIKAGLTRNSIQKYRCSGCRKYQQREYQKKAYEVTVRHNIIRLMTEGMGVRGTARYLSISATTVIARIKKTGKACIRPVYNHIKRTYEIDELWTYVGRKSNEVWVMYMLDRTTKAVIDLRVGPRNRKNIESLTGQLLCLEPKSVCTDGLSMYKTLIPSRLHRTAPMSTRHIERHNLNLRMHLKRLSRKTICFSKSIEMLEACLRIYFWRTAFHQQPA